MRNVVALFVGDARRITSNVVTAVIVLGLVLLPSIFSWYNILASWDVFQNTGNIKVAVANEDAGYESDLVALQVNIGDRVVSQLRENDQLSWVFTTEEDAVEGTASGRYYAAVVIPESFSRDMLTFYDDDVEHASIVYYANEKKSAIAPKVTDQGADQISYQVNTAFAEVVYETSLDVASAVAAYADDADAQGGVAEVAGRIGDVGERMTQTAQVLRLYAQTLASSQSLLEGSASLLAQEADQAGEAYEAVQREEAEVQTVAQAACQALDALSDALDEGGQGYASISGSIGDAASSADVLAGDLSAQLRAAASSAETQVASYQSVRDALAQLSGSLDGDDRAAVDAMVEGLDASIELQRQMASGLADAADALGADQADAQQAAVEAKALADAAATSAAQLSADYDSDIAPILDELATQATGAAERLDSVAAALDGAASGLSGDAASASGQLGSACNKLEAAAAALDASAQKMESLEQAMLEALSGDAMQSVRELLGADASTLASALSAPVQVERHAVYAADNFGSQMAPLYATLALWIGALLLSVVVKVEVSDAARAKLSNPKPWQLFLGRYGIFAALSLAQSTTMALGNMLFLHVQANHPLLYLLVFWVAGLVFSFIVYTLVASFANLGKAIAVLLLILQVTAGGGSFPLPLLPDFIQALSPYMPATHAISAMRAAMMGIYQGDLWVELACLLAFCVPMLLLGLVLRRPLERFLAWYVARVDESKLMA